MVKRAAAHIFFFYLRSSRITGLIIKGMYHHVEKFNEFTMVSKCRYNLILLFLNSHGCLL